MQTFSINFIVPQELTKWQKDTSLTEIRCRFDGNLEEIVEISIILRIFAPSILLEMTYNE